MATVFDRSFLYKELTKTTFGTDGLEIPGTLSTRTVRGTIQSVSGEEAVAYMQGSRNTGIVKIYSSERLSARSQHGDSVGYVESASGILYELVQELPFQNLPKITHWKYIASEIPAAQIPEALQ